MHTLLAAWRPHATAGRATRSYAIDVDRFGVVGHVTP